MILQILMNSQTWTWKFLRQPPLVLRARIGSLSIIPSNGLKVSPNVALYPKIWFKKKNNDLKDTGWALGSYLSLCNFLVIFVQNLYLFCSSNGHKNLQIQEYDKKSRKILSWPCILILKTILILKSKIQASIFGQKC